MDYWYSDEPIIACSTSTLANAALGVIRISGFKEVDLFNRFLSLSAGPIEPRRVYFTKLVHESSVIDEICLTFFPGPRSYTGENTLELSVHGNLLNIERILQLFIKEAGCRLAAPGEFTFRALKNKKLTLTQVEGLDLFLNANSNFALNQGMSLLNGSLHILYQELHQAFLEHKASLELRIDFAEDVGEAAALAQFDGSLANLSRKLDGLVKRVEVQSLNLLEPEISVIGLPNAGKSTLFNFLLAQDRSIVSPVAGTTRDYVSEHILFNGVRFRLTDTAGIRSALDEVEAEGIRRSFKKFSESFFSVLLINPLDVSPELESLLANEFDLVVFTHADQEGFDHRKNEFVNRWPQFGSIGAYDLTSNPRDLEEVIKHLVSKKYLDITSKHPLLLDRHKQQLLKAQNQLAAYENSIAYEDDVAILSSELNAVGHCFSELMGIISPEQLLNSIFNNFCIGK
jgi:tRNA modification GTPase